MHRRTLLLAGTGLLLACSLLAGVGCGTGSSASDVPTLISLTPTWGSPGGGTRVTLNCLQADSALTVFFNDQEATDVAFVRDQALNCTSPIGLVGLADVSVVAVGGSSAARGRGELGSSARRQHASRRERARRRRVRGHGHLR